MKIDRPIYLFEILNFDFPWQDKKSNSVLYCTSTQICHYFKSNLHQLIWIQYYFFRRHSTSKILQEGKSLS